MYFMLQVFYDYVFQQDILNNNINQDLMQELHLYFY